VFGSEHAVNSKTEVWGAPKRALKSANRFAARARSNGWLIRIWHVHLLHWARSRGTERGVTAVVVNEAVSSAAYVDNPCDLASVANPVGLGDKRAPGIMGGVKVCRCCRGSLASRHWHRRSFQLSGSVVDIEGGVAAIAVNEAVPAVAA
jgi:hypothetical protein